MDASGGGGISVPPCGPGRRVAVEALEVWMRAARRPLLSVDVDGTPVGVGNQVDDVRQLIRALPRSLLDPMDTAGRFTVRLPALRRWLDTTRGHADLGPADTQ